MRSFSLVQVAAESILANRLRTLLTMLGIIIGVGAVIVMVAVGEGAQSKIREQIQGLGTNLGLEFSGRRQRRSGQFQPPPGIGCREAPARRDHALGRLAHDHDLHTGHRRHG